MTSLTAGLAVLIGVFLAVKFTTDLIRERRGATLSGRFRSSAEQPPQIRSGLHFSSYFVTPQTQYLTTRSKTKSTERAAIVRLLGPS